MPYRPLADESGQIHVCAHRGHSVGAPENTLPALVAAAERGATVCEIDVVLTRDEEIVLMHDEVLDRTTNGRGLVADYDLAALRRLDAGSWFDTSFAGTPVPTLAEALVMARANDMGLLVEIKERRRAGRMIERLGDVLTATRSLDDVLVISFDHPFLLQARKRIPGARTELITHARHIDPAGMASRAGAASVAIEWDMFNPEDARTLHHAGIAVRVTMPRPERILLRKRYGLDDQVAVAEALSSGLIDALAGDDTDVIASLVRDSAITGAIAPPAC